MVTTGRNDNKKQSINLQPIKRINVMDKTARHYPSCFYSQPHHETVIMARHHHSCFTLNLSIK